jgi:hypothetical protein
MKIKGELIAFKYKSHNQNGEKNHCPEELSFHLCLEHLHRTFSLLVTISVFFVVDSVHKKSALD